MSAPARRVAKTAVAVAAAAALTAAGAWLSAGTFLAVNLTNPMRAEVDSLPRYWRWYGNDERHRIELMGSMALGFGICWVLLPIAMVRGLRTTRPLHGDARFATEAEIRKAKLLDGKGIIVGSWRGQYLMLPGQQYVLVAAPPRSGKGEGVGMPNCLNWGGSLVALDIKGDLEEQTSGFRAAHGQDVFVWEPFNEEGRTHRYNPLGYVRLNTQAAPGDGERKAMATKPGDTLRITDLQELARIFFPKDDTKGDADAGNFFAEKAADLFQALGMYLLETPESEMPHSIGQLLRLASGDGQPMPKYLAGLAKKREQQGRPLSSWCVAAINRFLQNPENTFGNILSTFTAALTAFSDPLVDAATAANDFDLREVRKRRMTVYVKVPFHKLAQGAVLIRLFFGQLIGLNVRELPEHNKALKHQCLVLLDEFTAPGRIDIVARGIGFLPQYDLRLLIMVQSQAQLSGTYGRDFAQAIRTACALHVYYAPKEQEDAKALSDLLGTYTERVVNRGTSSSSGRSGGSSSTSRNEQQHARAVLLPQEAREIGAGKEIVVLENCKPILCDKVIRHQDPLLAPRAKYPAVTRPVVDLNLHQARAEQRHRPVTAADGPRIAEERLVKEAPRVLPPEGADVEQMDAFIDDLFARVQAADAVAETPPTTEADAAEAPLLAVRESAAPARGKGRGAKGSRKPKAAAAVPEEPPELFSASEPVDEGDANGVHIDLSVLLDHDKPRDLTRSRDA